jgi:hypothetical protein
VLDANVTIASQLTGDFVALNPAPGAVGLGRLGFSYRMSDGVDFTDNGANNAILVDITSIGGPTPPPLLFVLVEDADEFFEVFFDLRAFHAPGAVVLPFERFGPRGGGSGSTDFKAVSAVFFLVYSNGLVNGAQDLGWNIEIDRVRVGNVPEPSTAYLSLFAAVLLVRQWSPVRKRSVRTGRRSDVASKFLWFAYRRSLPSNSTH